MKYSAIVLVALLAGCASHGAPPAESAAAVQAATDTPERGPSFAPAANDGEAAARADRSANAGTSPNGVKPAGAGNHGASDDAQSQNGASAPSTSGDGTEGTNSGAMPYPSNANALPAQSPPLADYEADNTRINARDRRGSALTPLDQGSSETDRKLTQRIRQTIASDDSLSFTAKNVKIITVNGRVTLRGPVRTDAERRAVGSAAKRIAGDAQVENYLEIAK